MSENFTTAGGVTALAPRRAHEISKKQAFGLELA